MEKAKKKVDFTEGKVFWKVLLFVLPIVATNLLQTFYNAADMMVVSLSKDGQNAVGAIGTTNSFVHLIVNIFIGFSVGANVVVAREIGAKDRARTQNAVHTSLIMAVIFGLVGMVLGIAVANPIMRLMGNEGRLLTLSVRYTCLYFAGVPFLALTNYLMAIFRAKGDAKTPLVVLTLAGLLNVGLNFFFVLVVDMSVEGVAIATAMSNVASFIILLVKLSRDEDDTQFSWKGLKIDRTAFKDIVFNGVPAGVQGALFSLSNMFIQSSVVKMNKILYPATKMNGHTPVVNGNAAATNLEAFAYTAMNAVYQGSITVTSQHVGAGKPKRVYRVLYVCLGIVTTVGMLLSAGIYLFRKPLLSLYNVKGNSLDEVQILAYKTAVTRFKYICLTYFLCGCMDVCSGVLRGLGRAISSMVISLIGACLLRLVWIWTVFPAWETLDSIFVSYPVSWGITLLTAFTFAHIFLRKIIKEKEATE